ncbi:MAG: hypothetical protein V1838_03240 [Patescibacteria group bacterium]
MNRHDLEIIVNHIASQGLLAISQNTDEKDLLINYMGIFAKDDTEFMEMDDIVKTLGTPGDNTATASGSTYLLNEPFNTPAGPLKVLKIRRPDPTRPQRGAPDFRVKDYSSFKEKYLSSTGNFSLMIRKDYEMLELKGVDVLVYFPSKTFDERQLISS